VGPEGALARRIAAAPSGEAVLEEAELYQRLAPRARLYGLKHLRDKSAAEDLAHEVLIHVIESLREGRVRDPDRIASFALGTCRIQVQEIRKTGLRRRRILERWADAEPRIADDLASPALDVKRLVLCMQNLTPRLQTVVALTFYAEQSSEEIARELGTSSGNIRVMRHRALGQLHDCLEGSTRSP
jgi:RNA polymerase sigma-70 factor (ECF subfamily)